ncbi:cytochrome c oxidase assembly protein (plasmid) [Alkalihalobacillus hwajinpoensis]|uniref:cytochrome c oxidase assembly protein n=1 Tax=Guptibacillus hwajinpoensis TaxID=208199 RepID=UPI001883C76F|nr:cytochrome c oxidase assembly protein [Pseudalkalibacillus hwajinpoensis]MBF0706803.1 cytochrome c oxidase assembly protein [Pseudalkalibacillus hwajinpoensis]
MNHQLTFFDLWNPYLFVLLILLAILFFRYIITQSKSNKVQKHSQKKKTILFILALVFYFIAEGSPLKAYGHYLFSFHMTSMAISYLIVPPLLLLSIPKWVFQPILKTKILKKSISFFTHPIVSVILFNVVLSFYHIPVIFDYIMSSMVYMHFMNYVLLLLAFFFWWPLVSPLPELNEVSHIKKLGYIFAAGVLLTPACALIIFSKELLYETYRNAPTIFRIFQPLDDQQAAGIIMKIIQEIVYGIALCVIFMSWSKKEKRQDDSVLSEIDAYEKRSGNFEFEGK